MTNFSLPNILKELQSGNRYVLSKCITLTESTKKEDQALSSQILSALPPSNTNSFRIGITGIPGVGKSMFIEVFGSFLTSSGKKVAVLSIDPSSSISKGSILGDKTRMEALSLDPLAFIRPSASGTHLGGVAMKTKEAILLCEAAGYEIILIETVGVGQNEIFVKNLVDYLLLLVLPGTGDALQSIKKGITEIANHIVVHKADKKNLKNAKIAKQSYEQAIQLVAANKDEWKPPVTLVSSFENTGIDEIWLEMKKYCSYAKKIGWFKKKRNQQNLNWLQQALYSKFKNYFFSNITSKHEWEEVKQQVANEQISVNDAIDKLFSKINSI